MTIEKMNKFINKEIYYSVALFLTPLLVLFGIYFYTNRTNKNLPSNADQAASVIQTRQTPNPFDGVEIEGRAGIVKELNTGRILYRKNAAEPFPLASITKIMTALVIYMNTEDLNQSVYISPNALFVEGHSFLRIGEKFKMKDLIDYMLLSSSNQSAAAVAETYQHNFPNVNFVQEMNKIAQNIGLENTHFLNPTGLDQNSVTAGSFGSAHDIALLFEFVLRHYPELFEATNDIEYRRYSESGILHNLTNTNTIIPQLHNLLGSKTGFTDLAGGNLGVIVDPGLNNPIVIVVLGSTRDGRFQDVLKLSETLEDYFDYQILNNN